MMKKIILIAACLFAASAIAAQTQAPKPATGAKPPAARGPSTTARRPPAFDPALLHPETLVARAPATFDVAFVTTAGNFTVSVTRAWAPLGADRFYNLVRHHFYDGAAFFRVLPGFMAQFGISAYPQVSRAWMDATIKDDRVTQSNRPGSLSFAMAGPNTRTTQIFINIGDNRGLDPMGFAPFAQVTDGIDVVDKLYNGYGEGAPDGNGPDQNLVAERGHAYLEQKFPKLDVIKSATLVTAPAVPASPASTPNK